MKTETAIREEIKKIDIAIEEQIRLGAWPNLAKAAALKAQQKSLLWALGEAVEL